MMDERPIRPNLKILVASLNPKNEVEMITMIEDLVFGIENMVVSKLYKNVATTKFREQLTALKHIYCRDLVYQNFAHKYSEFGHHE